MDVVVEDGFGSESDYHDTHRFYDWLKDNDNFVINTLMEFMAGRHDEKITGRIPRYAKDLLEFTIFKDILEASPALKAAVEDVGIKNDTQSVDLLCNRTILNYFKENQPTFKIFFDRMNKEQKTRYTNQQENYSE